jgi:hypothetical protein
VGSPKARGQLLRPSVAGRAWRGLPEPVRRLLVPPVIRLEAMRAAADRETYRRLVALRRGGRAELDDHDLVALRIRALGGSTVRIRPRPSDVRAVWTTFVGRYDLPPPALGTPSLVLDLGAKVGLSMAHMAARWPECRVVGVEPDPAAAELCRQNVAPWEPRCVLVEIGDEAGGLPVSLERLLSELTPGQDIDYLRMDLEGAEARVLRESARWARRVRCIKVEVHRAYTVAACARDLGALGFTTSVDSRHGAAVVGTRP